MQAVMTGKNEDPLKKEGMKELRAVYRGTSGRAVRDMLSDDPVYLELLDFTESERKRFATEEDSQSLAFLYHGLGLPAELIRFLVSFSVEKGRDDMRYIEKTGTDWAEAGILTAVEAKLRIRQQEEKKPGRPSSEKSRASEAKAGHAQERHTDYNELVMKELMEIMG